MHQKYFSLLDMAIVGIPVFAIGIWQLVSVNREIAKDRAKATPPEDASPESARHPVGEHGLDDR